MNFGRAVGLLYHPYDRSEISELLQFKYNGMFVPYIN